MPAEIGNYIINNQITGVSKNILYIKRIKPELQVTTKAKQSLHTLEIHPEVFEVKLTKKNCRFFFVGDTGHPNEKAKELADKITKEQFDFGILLGDIFYDKYESLLTSPASKAFQECIYNLFSPVQLESNLNSNSDSSSLSITPLFGVLGNHEYGFYKKANTKKEIEEQWDRLTKPINKFKEKFTHVISSLSYMYQSSHQSTGASLSVPKNKKQWNCVASIIEHAWDTKRQYGQPQIQFADGKTKDNQFLMSNRYYLIQIINKNNIHLCNIIVLDTNTIVLDLEQQEWLRKEATESQVPIIIAGHHCPTATGERRKPSKIFLHDYKLYGDPAPLKKDGVTPSSNYSHNAQVKMKIEEAVGAHNMSKIKMFIGGHEHNLSLIQNKKDGPIQIISGSFPKNSKQKITHRNLVEKKKIKYASTADGFSSIRISPEKIHLYFHDYKAIIRGQFLFDKDNILKSTTSIYYQNLFYNCLAIYCEAIKTGSINEDGNWHGKKGKSRLFDILNHILSLQKNENDFSENGIDKKYINELLSGSSYLNHLCKNNIQLFFSNTSSFRLERKNSAKNNAQLKSRKLEI